MSELGTKSSVSQSSMNTEWNASRRTTDQSTRLQSLLKTQVSRAQELSAASKELPTFLIQARQTSWSSSSRATSWESTWDTTAYVKLWCEDCSSPSRGYLSKHTLFIQKGSYNVIDTDYQTYSVVYSCWNDVFKIMKVESAWILAKSRTLDDTNLNKALEALKKLNVNTKNFIDTDQSGCQ